MLAAEPATSTSSPATFNAVLRETNITGDAMKDIRGDLLSTVVSTTYRRAHTPRVTDSRVVPSKAVIPALWVSG